MQFVAGLCVGYGFIEFARAEEAAMAIRLGNGRELGSKRVKVWYSRKPTPDMKGSNVYLQNYGPELEGWQLVELFSKFGTVININMLRGLITISNKNLLIIFFDGL